jgi:hypothetical protein
MQIIASFPETGKVGRRNGGWARFLTTKAENHKDTKGTKGWLVRPAIIKEKNYEY